MKPLGGKAYGSIAHLPNSRMGPADHHLHPGQAVICQEKARDKHDRIIVTEKVDGACVSVANIDGEIVPLIRAGYRADDAFFDHLRHFGAWALTERALFSELLRPGERFCGEWMAMAHGTVYTALPSPPFVVFDLFDGKVRRPFDDLSARLAGSPIAVVPVVSDGPPIPAVDALALIPPGGGFGAEGGPEGVVYRVERKGTVDFLAKYVRPDKADGIYLPEISGADAIWHWRAAA